MWQWPPLITKVIGSMRRRCWYEVRSGLIPCGESFLFRIAPAQNRRLFTKRACLGFVHLPGFNRSRWQLQHELSHRGSKGLLRLYRDAI